jgi:hypothetical protein
MAAGSKWRLSGDYFENCNCDVVCPCLVSTSAPLTARPTQGECNVPLVVHIDKGGLRRRRARRPERCNVLARRSKSNQVTALFVGFLLVGDAAQPQCGGERLQRPETPF